ncbi:MAG: hypothetical protein P1S46_03575 [bacterium]|nr:hypothetical protein [bacterium]MDT8395786.1 choice-of-anchor X domain-containing protein [bacterium]
MNNKTHCFRNYRVEVLVLAVSGLLLAFLAGCGSGSGVSITGGTEADQAAILAAVETEPFFVESVTGTDGDEDAAAAAQAQVYDGQAPVQSLAAQSGTAELPCFWWRGDLERLERETDDGTNGDLEAGDGVYTRLYTAGPCRGRHFAAVDVIDAATFMEPDWTFCDSIIVE